MDCTFRKILAHAEPGIVSVNGVVIGHDAIAREVQHHPAPKPVAAWQVAARALVIRELLSQRARLVGIIPAPLRDSAGKCETEEEALIRGLIEQEVATPEPDEETCRRYYERNLSRFQSPTLYEASHILFAARKDDREAFERARAEATAALEILSNEPGRFAELARMHSACPSREVGGNLGQITAGDTTPEFEAALMSLTPGSMTNAPIETRYGFHIIRLDRRIAGQELPFDMVRSQIATYLSTRVKRIAAAQYIARLAAKAHIEGITLPAPQDLRVA